MRRRTLTGNVAIAFFIASFFCIFTAFFTASWLVSDYRITGAKFDRLGLWTHCFRSLPDPNDVYARRFFVGCRWVYDPFTKGYDEIRGFLVPAFMVFTQLFFTVTFLCAFIIGILVLIYFLCCGPEQGNFLKLIKAIGLSLIGGGASGCLAVLIFGLWGNTEGWMPGYENNWFGYSYVLAIIGSIGFVTAGSLFLIEKSIQERKERNFKESQTRFQFEQESKA